MNYADQILIGNTFNFNMEKNLSKEYNLNEICFEFNNENYYNFQFVDSYENIQNFKSNDRSDETLSVCANAGFNMKESEDQTSKDNETNDIIEDVFKQQFKNKDFDSILDECLMSKECKDASKNTQNIRFKKTKSDDQIKKLKEALEKFPFKFPKKERSKLSQEIGLDEVQIYKWYYDNNPNKRAKAKAKKCVQSDSTISDCSISTH
jgi:hypothetical protein